MTTFDERRDELEKKYFHEEELHFKARSRRNRLFGLAVAEKIGKRDDDAANYARSLVMAAALHPSAEAELVRLVTIDLEAAGLPTSDAELQGLLAKLLIQAEAEIRSE